MKTRIKDEKVCRWPMGRRFPEGIVKKLAAFCAVVLAAQGAIAPAQTQTGRPFRLVFSKAEVGGVLKSISLQTGAKIIYSGEGLPVSATEPGRTATASGERAVTLDMTVASAEEAIRAVVASAGLQFRKVGTTFIVAHADHMKAALAPYAVQARFALTTMTSEDAAAFLQKAMPTIDARPAGSRVLVIAIPEDLMIARELLTERESFLADTRTVSMVVTLRHSVAEQIAKTLTTLFPGIKATPSVTGEQVGGSIALSGPKDQVDQAVRTIEEIDSPLPEPTPDVAFEVYTIKYGNATVLKEFLESAVAGVKVYVGPESFTPPQPGFRTLSGATVGTSTGTGTTGGASSTSTGSGLSSASAAGGTVQPFQRAKEGDRAKQLVLRGPAILVTAAIGLLAKVDIKPVQVQVEVKVIDTSPEKLIESGFDYSWRPFTAVETPAGTGFSGTLPPTGLIDIEATGLPTKAGFGAFSRVPWRIDMILQGLITKREAKLLASPNISVVDNDDASIFIGDTLRVQLSSTGNLGGSNVQVAEFPVGIILLLRPRVNADGNVTLRVHPVVSAITSISADGLPQTSTREADTTVIMKDGETIVMGGLIREELVKTVREVPILSSLPLVGELFKSRSTSQKRNDILLFITTRIVKDAEAGVAAAPADSKAGG